MVIIIVIQVRKQKMPDKVIGFTQSSCPALVLPSDEDYKTLPFVMSVQR
jgi:hypothetical protein